MKQLILFFLAFTGAATAQYVVSTKAGIIQWIEGEVFLDEKRVQLPAGYIQMENGQTLHTGKGRVELLLTPYSYVRTGHNALLRMEHNKFEGIQIVLERGCALIEVVEEIKPKAATIRHTKGSIVISKPGLYRLDADAGELRVYGGSALARTGDRQIRLKSGRMIRFDEINAQSKLDDDFDDLHHWASQRSFDLFVAGRSGRAQQPHWVPIAPRVYFGTGRGSSFKGAFFRNFNYRVQFFVDDEILNESRARTFAERQIQADDGRRETILAPAVPSLRNDKGP